MTRGWFPHLTRGRKGIASALTFALTAATVAIGVVVAPLAQAAGPSINLAATGSFEILLGAPVDYTLTSTNPSSNPRRRTRLQHDVPGRAARRGHLPGRYHHPHQLRVPDHVHRRVRRPGPRCGQRRRPPGRLGSGPELQGHPVHRVLPGRVELHRDRGRVRLDRPAPDPEVRPPTALQSSPGTSCRTPAGPSPRRSPPSASPSPSPAPRASCCAACTTTRRPCLERRRQQRLQPGPRTSS